MAIPTYKESCENNIANIFSKNRMMTVIKSLFYFMFRLVIARLFFACVVQLLYSAASDGGYVDSRKVEAILDVPDKQGAVAASETVGVAEQDPGK